MRALRFFVLLVAAAVVASAQIPAPVEGDYTIVNFKFRSGETLPELRLHYRTLGDVKNPAVLIMHGTGGSSTQFVRPPQSTESTQSTRPAQPARPTFADQLFAPGQLLDATKYFIVLPDDIGHGKSSKPSDGLHMKFPHYDYDDMIEAEYRLLTEHLKVKHLKLVMGTSMGGMHSWLWAETYPDFMDAAMPLASLPVEIAGRNRMTRKMAMDAIRNDPDFKNGEYKEQPRGLVTALYVLTWMGSAPLQYQKQYPTREAADKYVEDSVRMRMRTTDANDLLYQFDSSRNYNPSPKLEQIKCKLIAVNSADDQVNPPELGILEREIKRVPRGMAIVIPISDATRGHGSHSIPALWKQYLAQLL